MINSNSLVPTSPLISIMIAAFPIAVCAPAPDNKSGARQQVTKTDRNVCPTSFMGGACFTGLRADKIGKYLILCEIAAFGNLLIREFGENAV